MCTLTYLPLAQGFAINHTRDEVPERNSPEFPIIETTDNFTLYRPLDCVSKGSWMVISTDGSVGCLLNGAFEKHERTPPYKHSRGIVLLELMRAGQKETHLIEKDFSNIEPFTIVLFLNDKVVEMRWDGEKKYFKELDLAVPHIWSSATLYPDDKVRLREKWYTKWLKKKGKTPESVNEFHHKGGVGNPEYDIKMSRSYGPCSVSITSLVKEKDKGTMCFEDLVRNKKKCVDISYAS